MKNKKDALDIQLFVYRRLDNRFENLSDDSPRAYELHLIRKEALHEALGDVEGWSVNWGTADDTKSHELSESLISVISNPHLHAAVITAISFLGAELAKTTISEFAKQAVSAILSRLVPKQKEGKILNFMMRLPGGTIISVSRESEMSVSLGDQWPESHL